MSEWSSTTTYLDVKNEENEKLELPSMEEEQPDKREVNTMNANRMGFNPAVPNSCSSIEWRNNIDDTNGINEV